ncbi:hypothetical protein [Streptomyces sp. NPDC091212]|uniref:hypothetical protein n=1 Tax=Streptomyces sp. NPDC091212 TaxID=3155191 RepID=UPI0034233474
MTAQTHIAAHRTIPARATVPARSVPATTTLRHQLWARLRTAVGREVIEVRLTPYHRGSTWCVMALGTNRHEVPLPKGAARAISDGLRRAFPDAAWDVAQDYDVTTGVLTEHVTVLPACLRDLGETR